MNYARQNHIGNYQNAQTKTATAIAPTIGRVRPLDATPKRCKRSAERQTAIRTDSHVANGFLKCTFLPKLKASETIQACKTNTERDFYTSLSQLAEHYQIEPLPTENFGFPYNIVLGLWDMETQLSRTHINWNSLMLVQDSQRTYLESVEKFDTGTNLYYIPIVPLFLMLKDPKRKKTAQLLISVCSYLYHIADVPYYKQEDSYLYWLYEMMLDWVEQDDENEDSQNNKTELLEAQIIGDKMEQKLFNIANLKVFEQRLNQFKSRNPFEQECWEIARNAFELFSEYPTTSIFRNAQNHEQDPYNDDFENGTIGMEKYISFVADTKGWLYNSIEECINNEFNEYGAMEEPSICKRFDGTEISTINLDFENRLFALLNNLCTLLNDFKTEEK